MHATPTRSDHNTSIQNLTPIRFLDSPKAAKSTSSDANFAASKARLQTIISTLQSDYAKWLVAQKSGLSTCYAIEKIKTKCLSELEKGGGAVAPTAYPPELKALCDKLAYIAQVMADITRNTGESLKQLRALNKLPGARNEIFYFSWRMEEYVRFVEELAGYYEKELLIKQHITKELPHCTSSADLIRCTCAWEYPQFVDSWVNVMFAFLNKEIKL